MILFLATFFSIICADAQIIEKNDSLFKYRIKLVESFMEHFNSGKNIVSLFDAQMLGADSKAAEDFSNAVSTTGVKLNYADTSWFAVAPCHGKFKGKSVDFMLILNVENYGKDLYKWVIAKAQGDFFKLSPPSTDQTIITPLAHETNFMELARINSTSILNVSQKRYKLDETSVFFAFYNSGLLDIEYVSDLQFIFLQVPGYVFTVMEFDRESKNSGWLISSFEKIKDNDKINFLKNVYHEK